MKGHEVLTPHYCCFVLKCDADLERKLTLQRKFAVPSSDEGEHMQHVNMTLQRGIVLIFENLY